jgi:1,2-diacylglycerol 3-alpha-glucosyltransferase
VDTHTFSQRDPEAVEAFRRRFAIPEGDRLLAFVGRLGLEKNVDALIDAMSFVRTPGARLLVVGDGPHRDDLAHHIAKDRVADRVTFTGYLGPDDVRAAYHASEALFFASTSETQGLVIAEAMATGLPVVAVDDLAIADAVTDGVNGFLVPEDPQALAKAVDRLLGDASLRSSMSASSLERAEDLCIDRQAGRLVEIYTTLVAASPSPRRGGEATVVGRRVMRQIGSLRRRGSRMVRRYL